MQKELSKSSHLVSDDLHKDLVSIISQTEKPKSNCYYK